jgi:hypothetical protein
MSDTDNAPTPADAWRRYLAFRQQWLDRQPVVLSPTAWNELVKRSTPRRAKSSLSWIRASEPIADGH